MSTTTATSTLGRRSYGVLSGAPLTGVPLLGRGDLHWNSYLQAHKSPLDGQWWTEEQQEGPAARRSEDQPRDRRWLNLTTGEGEHLCLQPGAVGDVDSVVETARSPNDLGR